MAGRQERGLLWAGRCNSCRRHGRLRAVVLMGIRALFLAGGNTPARIPRRTPRTTLPSARSLAGPSRRPGTDSSTSRNSTYRKAPMTGMSRRTLLLGGLGLAPPPDGLHLRAGRRPRPLRVWPDADAPADTSRPGQRIARAGLDRQACDPRPRRTHRPYLKPTATPRPGPSQGYRG